MDEVKHVGLALDPIDTPRYTSRPAASYKSIEKPNRNKALMLKSFTLERSIKKINVLQTRNYLKKPYMKSNISVTSSVKVNSVVQHKRKEIESENIDDLEDVKNIFEGSNPHKNKVEQNKVENGKSLSLKFTNVKNSFNKGINIVIDDFRDE